ncbi:MAG: hypothetical protein JKX81_19795 [Arenicella sp.]|nr:hypothetical protein [Arenicella sp.]
MKNNLSLILIITFFYFCVSSQASAEVHLCGITGELLQSEQPCEIPTTDISLSPIRTDTIDKTVFDSTVEMFRTATVNRDIYAIERFLADDFVFISNEESWDGKEIFNTGKQGFVAVMRQHLLAMTDYHQVIESYSLKTISGQLIAETISVEKVELGDKKIEARLLERIELVVIEGFAKLQSIRK